MIPVWRLSLSSYTLKLFACSSCLMPVPSQFYDMFESSTLTWSIIPTLVAFAEPRASLVKPVYGLLPVECRMLLLSEDCCLALARVPATVVPSSLVSPSICCLPTSKSPSWTNSWRSSLGKRLLCCKPGTLFWGTLVDVRDQFCRMKLLWYGLSITVFSLAASCYSLSACASWTCEELLAASIGCLLIWKGTPLFNSSTIIMSAKSWVVFCMI